MKSFQSKVEAIGQKGVDAAPWHSTCPSEKVPGFNP